MVVLLLILGLLALMLASLRWIVLCVRHFVALDGPVCISRPIMRGGTVTNLPQGAIRVQAARHMVMSGGQLGRPNCPSLRRLFEPCTTIPAYRSVHLRSGIQYFLNLPVENVLTGV